MRNCCSAVVIRSAPGEPTARTAPGLRATLDFFHGHDRGDRPLLYAGTGRGDDAFAPKIKGSLQAAVNKAIKNGVAWLKKRQAKDGSWLHNAHRESPLAHRSVACDEVRRVKHHNAKDLLLQVPH